MGRGTQIGYGQADLIRPKEAVISQVTGAIEQSRCCYEHHRQGNIGNSPKAQQRQRWRRDIAYKPIRLTGADFPSMALLS